MSPNKYSFNASPFETRRDDFQLQLHRYWLLLKDLQHHFLYLTTNSLYGGSLRAGAANMNHPIHVIDVFELANQLDGAERSPNDDDGLRWRCAESSFTPLAQIHALFNCFQLTTRRRLTRENLTSGFYYLAEENPPQIPSPVPPTHLGHGLLVRLGDVGELRLEFGIGGCWVVASSCCWLRR